MFKISTLLSIASKNSKRTLGKFIQEFGGDIERWGCVYLSDVAYKQKLSRHRNVNLVRDIKPEINNTSFISENCTLLGDVQIQSYSNIGYNVIMRAEENTIR